MARDAIYLDFADAKRLQNDLDAPCESTRPNGGRSVTYFG